MCSRQLQVRPGTFCRKLCSSYQCLTLLWHCKQKNPPVQEGLIIRGLFIWGFPHSGSREICQNSEFTDFLKIFSHLFAIFGKNSNQIQHKMLFLGQYSTASLFAVSKFVEFCQKLSTSNYEGHLYWEICFFLFELEQSLRKVKKYINYMMKFPNLLCLPKLLLTNLQ